MPELLADVLAEAAVVIVAFFGLCRLFLFCGFFLSWVFADWNFERRFLIRERRRSVNVLNGSPEF